jgi:putative nucleotidyltransferase with HDIG domain
MVSGLSINRDVHSKLLKSLDRIPRLSPNVNRLVAALINVDAEVEEITSLVERDTLLAAHILRLANSALYSHRQSIISIRQAVTYLGLTTMRRVALSLSLLRMISRLQTPASWSFVRFNQHAAATATLAEMLAQALPVDGAEHAFVAGLLHDLGKVIIAVGVPRLYEDIVALSRTSGRPLTDCERELIGIDHADLSALMLVRWHLDDAVCRAVRFHHAEESADQKRLPLSAILRIADQQVNHLGISVVAGRPPEPVELTAYNGQAVSLEPCFTRFEAEWPQVASLLG